MQASELALAQYREKQDAGALDSSQNIVVARLTQLNEAVTKARTDRIQKESQWKQIQAAGKDVESISSVIANPAVQNLQDAAQRLQQERSRVSERYGEKHPDFIKVTTQLANAERQLELEINKAVQNAKNEYEQRGHPGARDQRSRSTNRSQPPPTWAARAWTIRRCSARPNRIARSTASC